MHTLDDKVRLPRNEFRSRARWYAKHVTRRFLAPRWRWVPLLLLAAWPLPSFSMGWFFLLGLGLSGVCGWQLLTADYSAVQRVLESERSVAYTRLRYARINAYYDLRQIPIHRASWLLACSLGLFLSTPAALQGFLVILFWHAAFLLTEPRRRARMDLSPEKKHPDPAMNAVVTGKIADPSQWRADQFKDMARSDRRIFGETSAASALSYPEPQALTPRPPRAPESIGLAAAAPKTSGARQPARKGNCPRCRTRDVQPCSWCKGKGSTTSIAGALVGAFAQSNHPDVNRDPCNRCTGKGTECPSCGHSTYR